MLRTRRVVEGVRTGAHRSPMHGQSVEFAEHKEYTPGDEIRRIDWKVFGRSDKYQVKRFEEETNLLAHILIDTSASMGYGRATADRQSWWQRLRDRRKDAGPSVDPAQEPIHTKHEYATLLAAALAYLLVGQGDAVGLYAFGDGDKRYLPPRTRPSHLHTVMGTLSSIQPKGQGQIAKALVDFAPRVTRRGLIVLISDLLEDPEEVLQTMKNLRTRRNDVVVMQVLHADELSFPFDEVSQFEDPEDRRQQLIVDPRDMREGYLKELNGFLELVKRRCFESQVDHILMDTSVPVSTALASFLARRAAVGGRR